MGQFTMPNMNIGMTLRTTLDVKLVKVPNIISNLDKYLRVLSSEPRVLELSGELEAGTDKYPELLKNPVVLIMFNNCVVFDSVNSAYKSIVNHIDNLSNNREINLALHAKYVLGIKTFNSDEVFNIINTHPLANYWDSYINRIDDKLYLRRLIIDADLDSLNNKLKITYPEHIKGQEQAHEYSIEYNIDSSLEILRHFRDEMISKIPERLI